jgi:mRNA-degrading endonuclease RelE of RelBE toxin-antitoxin system
MSYKIITIAPFDKKAKRLSKKYPSLKHEFAELIQTLEVNPTIGSKVFKNCYKIRLSIKSKGKGKSGGARIITYVIIDEKSVYLLDIFDKSEKGNISDSELRKLIKFVRP